MLFIEQKISTNNLFQWNNLFLSLKNPKAYLALIDMLLNVMQANSKFSAHKFNMCYQKIYIGFAIMKSYFKWDALWTHQVMFGGVHETNT